eukprot:COSAG01_NODE_68411_length_264_cov_0.630303_1_plen_37_part_01
MQPKRFYFWRVEGPGSVVGAPEIAESLSSQGEWAVSI